MNSDHMREFYDRAGYRVASTASGDWYVAGERVYKNFPCGHTLWPERSELEALSRRAGIIGVEFYNDREVGITSGLWVARDRHYGLHSLQRQFRQHVQRALEHGEVRAIGFDELHRRATAANRESDVRLRRADHHLNEPGRWNHLCDAGMRTPGAGAFASFDAQGLSAYLVYFIVGDTCYGLIARSRDAARRNGSNHALYYHYTGAMLARPEITTVTLGIQALPPAPGVDSMKRHAGYELQRFAVAGVLRRSAQAVLTGTVGGLALRLGTRLLGAHPGVERARALREMARATRNELAGRGGAA